MKLSRRAFSIGLASSAFSGLAIGSKLNSKAGKIPDYNQIYGYGKLVEDKQGLLDLPAGFSYRIISKAGNTMSDGISAPTRFDGMGCIALDNQKVALVRNHELAAQHLNYDPLANYKGSEPQVYDRYKDGRSLPGGTSTVVYNLTTGQVEKEYMSLLGTLRNCSGGITPWGSWLTCEESVTREGEDVGKDHGYVFEVPATESGLVNPVPLKQMGRFNHEAAAVEPKSGVVYLTEDRGDGLFYRFIPKQPGVLSAGGQLQALCVKGHSDSRNWDGNQWKSGEWLSVHWVDLDDPQSPKDDLRIRGRKVGAALFARGEGVHWGDQQCYFCCTSGGTAKLGQVMEYQPSAFEGTDKETQAPGRIRLLAEPNNPDWFNFADNLTVAPNGHLIVCEDQYTKIVHNHLRGITPDGLCYTLASSPAQTEFAGACFSPDGKTLFVNLYDPGKTLAITGPWGNFKV